MTPKTEGKNYTILIEFFENEEVRSAKARDFGEAWKKVAPYLPSLIVEGTFAAINVKKIKREDLPKGLNVRDAIKQELLKEGDECRVVVGDPRSITGAKFKGLEKIEGINDMCAMFEKSNTRFIAGTEDFVITHINSCRVGL